MNKFVDVLVNRDEILEINARYKIPNQTIIKKVKDAGVKFALGTNNAAKDRGKPIYGIEMKKACSITA